LRRTQGAGCSADPRVPARALVTARPPWTVLPQRARDHGCRTNRPAAGRWGRLPWRWAWT